LNRWNHENSMRFPAIGGGSQAAREARFLAVAIALFGALIIATLLIYALAA
jgi:hypothetical protein